MDSSDYKVPSSQEIIDLIHKEFTDKDVAGVAMYILSCSAVAEAAYAGILTKKAAIENVPPVAVDMMYKFDSALVNNEFYLKNFAVLKSATTLDRIKLAATVEVSKEGYETKDKACYRAAKQLTLSQFDSLILLAFVWKGYDFSVEFAGKLHKIIRLTPALEEYFSEVL